MEQSAVAPLATAFGIHCSTGMGQEGEPDGLPQGYKRKTAALLNSGSCLELGGSSQQQAAAGAGWGDLRHARKRSCSTADLSSYGGDAPQLASSAASGDTAHLVASAGHGYAATRVAVDAAAAAAAMAVHSTHPGISAGGVGIQRQHPYDLRSGSGRAGAEGSSSTHHGQGAWVAANGHYPQQQQQQGQKYQQQQQQLLLQLAAQHVRHHALPPRHPQWPGPAAAMALQQLPPQQHHHYHHHHHYHQQGGSGAEAGPFMAAASRIPFGAAMPPAAAPGLAVLLPQPAAAPPPPVQHATQQAFLHPAFARMHGFVATGAAAAPRPVPGFPVQVPPAAAAAVAAAPAPGAWPGSSDSQEEAWDSLGAFPSEAEFYVDLREEGWEQGEGPACEEPEDSFHSAASSPQGDSFELDSCELGCQAASVAAGSQQQAAGPRRSAAPAPTPPPSPAEGASSPPPPRAPAPSRQLLVEQLREANAVMRDIRVPEGCDYIPVHETDCLLDLVTYGYGIPPLCVALGASYLQRLLLNDKGALCATAQNCWLVRVPICYEPAAGVPPPSIVMMRANNQHPALLALYTACIYVAAKVADRVQYREQLSSMLRRVLGLQQPLDPGMASVLELQVLTGLSWRLGPVFDLGPALGPF